VSAEESHTKWRPAGGFFSTLLAKAVRGVGSQRQLFVEFDPVSFRVLDPGVPPALPFEQVAVGLDPDHGQAIQDGIQVIHSEAEDVATLVARASTPGARLMASTGFSRTSLVSKSLV